MKFPHPSEKLAGCCWLPRLAAKTRAYLGGDLPFIYRMALGSSLGVDGYFLQHFHLLCSQMIAAVKAMPSDEALGKWFLDRPAVTPNTIAEWNAFAPQIGMKGRPGYLTLQVAKRILYPGIALHQIGSMFELVELDEYPK